MPWLTCTHDRRKPSGRASRRSTSSSTTESRPPDKPSTSFVPGKSKCLSAAPTVTSMLSELFGFDFLELAIVHQAVEARLDQLVDALAGERSQRCLLYTSP